MTDQQSALIGYSSPFICETGQWADSRPRWADQFAEGAPPDYVEALNDWNDKVDRASKGEPFEEIASNSEEESVSGVESNVSAPKPSIAPSESVNSSRQEMKPDPDVDSEQ